MNKETADLFKLLAKEAKRKSWVGNRADPTQVTTYEWDIKNEDGTTTNIELTAVWEIELKVNGVRISYGHETPVGKLAEWIFGMLEGVYYDMYMDGPENYIDWSTVSAKLQDAGFFARYGSTPDGEEWLEVCVPDKDLREYEVKRALGGIDVEIKEIPNYGEHDHIWCRLTEA